MSAPPILPTRRCGTDFLAADGGADGGAARRTGGALDQFAFRFARLQDTLGQKLFRAVLVGALREPYEDSPMRDVLDRLERLRLLPSADRWEEIRAARISLTHDYPDTPAQRAARLNVARQMVDEMASILAALEAASGR